MYHIASAEQTTGGASMLNTAKLSSAIKQRRLTNAILANSIGVGRTTFYRKLKNDGDTLLLWEIQSIIKRLKLTRQDVVEIFFPDLHDGTHALSPPERKEVNQCHTTYT